MMGDLDTLTKLREAQATNNQEAMNKEFSRLDADQKQLALTYFKGGMSSIEFVAQSTMNRIGNRRAPELATSMEQKAIAGWDWMPLGQLARGKNPSFNPSVLANKVKGGVAGWGTNESQVYAGLGGARTAVERAALAKCYEALFHVSMEADVKDDMDDHELERAKALMEGKAAEADAATIKEAIAGMGTDEQAIRDALRGKSPEELEAIKAEYKRMYGVELKTDISGDMEDAEVDNALALADGDVDKADAAELEDAMDGRRDQRGEAPAGLRADPRGGGGPREEGRHHAGRAQAADPRPQRPGQGQVRGQVRRPGREAPGRAARRRGAPEAGHPPGGGRRLGPQGPGGAPDRRSVQDRRRQGLSRAQGRLRQRRRAREDRPQPAAPGRARRRARDEVGPDEARRAQGVRRHQPGGLRRQVSEARPRRRRTPR